LRVIDEQPADLATRVRERAGRGDGRTSENNRPQNSIT
jgi:hypothetical protein